MLPTYNFINHSQCKITETFGYSTYGIKKVNKSSIDEDDNNSNTSPLRKKILGSAIHHLIETQSKKYLSFHIHNKGNKTNKVILVDDEKDILFTYESFLKDNGYEIITFKSPIMHRLHQRPFKF